MPDPSGGPPAPGTAPPGASPPGLQSVPNGGQGGALEGGVQPPSASAPPAGGGVHPAGVHALGMEGMKKIMGAMHMFRAMLDPQSEESKAADKMFNAGRKHFIPDMQSSQGGQMPQMGAGGPGGQPGPMRPPGGGTQLPMTNQNNLPTGPVPMRQ